MSRKLFLQELCSQNWGIEPTAINHLRAMAVKYPELLSGKPDPISLQVRSIDGTASISAQYNPGEDPEIFKNYPQGSIAIIPLIGIMTKYGSWWNWGVDEIADLIRSAQDAENISGVVLIIDTPGGSVSSVYQITDAIKNSTKPIFGLVTGNCCSCGEYVRSFLGKSYALHPMCEFGSVGVMASFEDWSKYEEKIGLTTTVIYPPESKFKNLPEREAIDGRPDLIIKEELSPWAIHFQDIMKMNHPALDLSVEGVLEGKTFFAKDAINYGLVSGIKNLDEVVTDIYAEISNRQTILSI